MNKGAVLRAERFRAIDWLRGLSVLFMIECHALFFIKPELEYTPFWLWIQGWNGMVSVSFLFAAGFAAGLVGTRGIARATDPVARAARSRRTLVRIAQVWSISVFFRISSSINFADPASLLNPGTLKYLLIAILKFDILVCICVGLLTVWAVMNLCRPRVWLATTLLGGVLVASLALTPAAMAYRGNAVVTGWLNSSTGSMFTPFPFAAYLLLGALLGIAAARARGGRQLVVCGLALTTLVGYTLGETRVAIDWWQSVGTWDYVMPLPNLFERLWKLGVIGLVLCGLEWAWPIVGRALAPVTAVLEYFSRNALPAFFVHLSLLYGFCGIHFTHQWHRNSSWSQYAWRVGALYAATFAICYALGRAKQLILDARERVAYEPTSLSVPEIA